MQRLEVSGAVRLIYRSLGIKGLKRAESKHKLRAYVVKTPKKTRMVREQQTLLCILLATGAHGSALTVILLSCAS